MGESSMGAVNHNGPVCLIRPPAVETFRFSSLSITPPLGLAYVAGAIERAGHRVEVVDAVAEAPQQHTRYFRGYLVGLQFADIANGKALPEAAVCDIDLWTGCIAGGLPVDEWCAAITAAASPGAIATSISRRVLVVVSSFGPLYVRQFFSPTWRIRSASSASP